MICLLKDNVGVVHLMSKWVLIQGSPRVNGKSARICRMISMHLANVAPEVELYTFDVAQRDVMGCNGCEYCRSNDTCIIDDDMNCLIEELDRADRVILVTPIYFASLPSQTKAVIDRLQPYFWDYVARRKNSGKEFAGEDEDAQPLETDGVVPSAHVSSKRPLTLYVVGDGGDPHGYEPLYISVKSSFALAGFSIDHCVEIIGKKRITAKDADLAYLERAAQ